MELKLLFIYKHNYINSKKKIFKIIIKANTIEAVCFVKIYTTYIYICMYVWNIHKSNYNKNIGEIAYIYIHVHNINF